MSSDVKDMRAVSSNKVLIRSVCYSIVKDVPLKVKYSYVIYTKNANNELTVCWVGIGDDLLQLSDILDTCTLQTATVLFTSGW
jgi:hypothetical protein